MTDMTDREAESFNGATTLQWWIHRPRPSGTTRQRVCFNGATTLQWWIRRQTGRSEVPGAPRFNGATTLQWWIRDWEEAVRRVKAWLQWGHHFAVVDTAPPANRCGTCRIPASMGPPLCSGGYPMMDRLTCTPSSKLQWGHHFAVVDTRRG